MFFCDNCLFFIVFWCVFLTIFSKNFGSSSIAFGRALGVSPRRPEEVLAAREISELGHEGLN